MKLLASLLLLALAFLEPALSAPMLMKGALDSAQVYFSTTLDFFPTHHLTPRARGGGGGGKAASSPPSKLPTPVQFKKPTGNLQKDLKGINQQAASHKKEDVHILNSNIAKNHADARAHPQNAKADAKADGKWRGFIRADRKNDEKSRHQAIGAARKADVKGGGGGRKGRG